MNSSLEVLDHVRLNFSPSGLIFLNIALSFIMFGVGARYQNRKFRGNYPEAEIGHCRIYQSDFFIAGVYFFAGTLAKPNTNNCTRNDFGSRLSRWKYFEFHQFDGSRQCSFGYKPDSDFNFDGHILYTIQLCSLG